MCTPNTEHSTVQTLSPPPSSISFDPAPTSNTFLSLSRSRAIEPSLPAPNPNPSNTSRPLKGDASTACSLRKVQKELVLFRFLQEREGMCIVHSLVGANATHKFFSCSASRKIFQSFKAFRSQIHYSQHGICYRCGVLTSDRFDHPLRTKDGNPACKYDDILKPLAFAIFSIPPLRDIVIPEACGRPLDFRSIGDYAKWLGEVPAGSESMFNLWEVCHAYVHLLNHNRCVYPF